MSTDYSISLNGLQTAERNLNQAARQIAASGLPSPGASPDSLSLSDMAKELLAANQAKIAAEANLRVISTESELDREALNLYA